MDNRSNMVKTIKCMPNIIQIPCMAHTLQLVIGKELIDAELLVSCPKRLMLFFTMPKQMERLLNAQRNDLENYNHQLRIITDVPTSAITVIKQELLIYNNNSNIDFDFSFDVFDDDAIYEGNKEVVDNYISSKQQCVNINNSQNCIDLEKKVKSILYDAILHYWDVPSNEAILAMLLDPQCKPLLFMTESLTNRAFELLKTVYKES
ncbi:hypothetical protein C2G38_2183263 [Gigaspora rosea]|uniref:Uncharacterized protein n=1 Tax=Gigaspora rosea TaxID=44941 RepID=A0A397V930_9GLOM|nr:hypothetical protein C2G38_2183263 [Gigaspora rosea]